MRKDMDSEIVSIVGALFLLGLLVYFVTLFVNFW